MGTVVKLHVVPRVAPPPPAAAPASTSGARPGRAVLMAVWVTLSFLWPVLRWVLAIDVFFQLVRALWYWNTPGVHAGLTFLLHFGVLTALTYFVAFFDPKGGRR